MTENTPHQYRPLAPYEARYNDTTRSMAAPSSGDPTIWQSWRADLRSRLRMRLGDLPAQRMPFAPAALESLGPEQPIAAGGATRRLIQFASAPGVTVPAWLLMPGQLRGPAPAVLAIHGHGYGADDLVGLAADGSARTAPEGFHQDFALALCQRGMVVLAPELAGFGRRREPADMAGGPSANSCHTAAWWGIMQGRPLLGGRVWDVLRAFDLLRTLPLVNPQRIGIMGGSGGGAVALLAAALEPELAAVVLSCYFCTFRDSILALRHCACNYVPGLLQDAEMCDLAALIAPRRLLIEAGEDDPIFPLHGVLAAYAQLQARYTALGAAGRLECDIGPGGHQIRGAQAYRFLSAALAEPGERASGL